MTGMTLIVSPLLDHDLFAVQVDLTFARELSFYMVTIYTPCFMIVVVSWFSFWLDYKVHPLSFWPIRDRS
jgi:hypothetical protein